jgi:DNA-binding SARP family transcriptional activator
LSQAPNDEHEQVTPAIIRLCAFRGVAFNFQPAQTTNRVEWVWKGIANMSRVKVSLFGQLSVECEGEVWHGPKKSKARELFCYLLIHNAAKHNRERLAYLLWEESSASESKKYLRQTLWQLGTACNEHLGEVNGRLFLVSPEWVQVNQEIELWVDVTVFEHAFSRLRETSDLDENSAQSLDEATRLYKDDLLVGLYKDWCLHERERLHKMYLTMLDKLAEYCETNRDYRTGVEYSARALRLDPARERSHQQIMRMYYLAGDRTAALQQFDRCVEALKKELNVGPTQNTLKLYEQICKDHFTQSSVISPPNVDVTEPYTLVLNVLMHLKQLQNKLVELQSEVQQKIQAVERAIPRFKNRS